MKVKSLVVTMPPLNYKLPNKKSQCQTRETSY